MYVMEIMELPRPKTIWVFISQKNESPSFAALACQFTVQDPNILID